MIATAYAAVYLRNPTTRWPFDLGDDPSFEASQQLAHAGGVLTWGVCRRGIRNALTPGDVVIFFAADRLADRRPEPGRYHFVGYATVERKVSQREVWEDEALSVFRHYRNLLLRPSGREYIHYETGPRQFWHDEDWLWRLTNMSGIRAPQLREFNDKHEWDQSVTLAGRPIRLARNYVLFRPEGKGTFVAAEPPVVAQAAANGQPETWTNDEFAVKLRAIVVGGSRTARQGLRTRNTQTSHNHIRLQAHPAAVFAELEALCAEHGVEPRHLPAR
jgi:hypothetical protein